jgi:type II secretory ATPase GspE/PulE/Tfp pilus assembly ATPase PilB-like protein
MSDLSLPPITDDADGSSPGGAGPAASQWPMPDAAGAADSWPLADSEPCNILGLNDKSFDGRMARFDARNGIVQVFVPPARSPMQLRFAQFQRLTLTEPMIPPAPGSLAAPGWLEPQARGETEFTVTLSNGKTWSGRTVGHVENDHGLFLFPPIGEAGFVQRAFCPRSAYRRADFGLRLGDVLVDADTLSPAQVETALAEQQRLRSLKLGEILVDVELITQEQLEQALALQANTPMLRLGEALISLKVLTGAELARALRGQARNRSLPLGELLVNHGLITREELREALDVQRAEAPGSGPPTPQIGEMLVLHSTATPAQVNAALAEQDRLRGQRVGEVLLSKNVVTPEQLVAALEAQSRMPMVRIGEALIALGFITQEQLGVALESQGKDRSVPLGEVLVREGLITRSDLSTALARKMGYPQVDVQSFPVDVEALRKLPVAAAQRLGMLPVSLLNGKLVVAMEDPSRRDRIDEAEFQTQLKVVPVLAAGGDLAGQIPIIYGRIGFDDGSLNFNIQAAEAQGTDTLLAALELPDLGPAPVDIEESAVEQSDTSLVRLINSMIYEAHNQGVSDIHIETRPGREKVRVRFRVDGALRPYLELPHTYRAAMIARLKIMCDLDISEKRRPQDGKINFARFVPQCPIELRVAMIPTSNGLEDAVLRILASAKPLPLDSLGMSEYNLESLKHAIERPYGMVLCVGPTGSGKTTTLHSALSYINTPERKIWTAEDPVEITQAGLRQVQVNPRIDWTFAKALRAFLRADPDVIMVGEIRDAETAQIAVESSLTGHLVLSTLHTNSAPETITRLLDMGMDPFNFADSLLAVLAQRLVRRICQGCKTATPATEEQVDELLNDALHVWGDHPAAPTRADLLADWQARHAVDGRLVAYHGAGCAKCGNTGLKGRAGLHELLVVSREVRRLVQGRARAEEILHLAMGEGLRTLRQDGIEKVLAGITTIEEVRATSNA